MKKVSLVAQAQRMGVALLCGFLFVACGGDDTGTKTKPGQEEDKDMSAMEQKDVSVEEDIVKEPEPEEPPRVATSIQTRLSMNTASAGQTIDVMCDVLDANGEIMLFEGEDAPAMLARYSPRDSLSSVLDLTYRAIRTGTVQIGCISEDLGLVDETPEVLEITPGAPFAVTTETNKRTFKVAEKITATCEVFDEYGNLIPDAAPTLSVLPQGDGVQVNGLKAEITRTGIYSVGCDIDGAQKKEVVEVEIQPGLPAHIAIMKRPNLPVYGIGQVVEVQTVVTDEYGNQIPDAKVNFVSMPEGTAFGSGRFRYAFEGTYTITAEVEGPTHMDMELVQSTEVVVNGNGPTIFCTIPADGDQITANHGEGIMLEGQLNDVNGVDTVEVNGRSLMVDEEGKFKTTQTVKYGINFIDITAKDSFGVENSRTCAFQVSSQWVPENSYQSDSLNLKLTQEAVDDFNENDGLDSLSDILRAVLNSQGLKDSLDSALRSQGRFYDECLVDTWLGCATSAKIDYRELKIDGPNDVALSLVNDGLNMVVTVRRIGIKARVHGKVTAVSYGTTGWATTDFIKVDLTSDLKLDALGRPSISLRQINSVQVGRVDLDFGGLAGVIIDVLEFVFEGRIRDLVRDTIRDYVNQEFNALLDGIVSGLDVDSLGSQFDVPKLDGSGTIPIGFGVRFSSLSTTPMRALFGLSSRFTGMIKRAGQTLGTAIPAGPSGLDPMVMNPVGVAVHVGVMNHVLHALWRAGWFDATIGGSSLSGSLPAGTSVELTTNLPPMVVLVSDKKIQLHIGAMRLRLTYPGVFDQPLFVTLGVKANTVATLTGDKLGFGNIILEELHFSTPKVSLESSTKGILESFLRTLLQSVINDSLNNALPALPIPRFDMPPSIMQYGLPYPGSLGINNADFEHTSRHFILDGHFGF